MSPGGPEGVLVLSSHRKHGRAPGASARSEHDQFEAALRGRDERPRSAGPDRKTLQLCRQVQRAVLMSIDEPDVTVDGVEPAGRSAGQLVVRVGIGPGASPMEVVARLNARGPQLRAAVAAAISRKRVPSLAFVAVPRTGGDHD